jgi:hypothetical protein
MLSEVSSNRREGKDMTNRQCQVRMVRRMVPRRIEPLRLRAQTWADSGGNPDGISSQLKIMVRGSLPRARAMARQ